MSRRRRLAMVNRGHPGLSVVKQCRLLQLSRSAVYYRPTPTNPADLDLMAGMDRQYLKTPYYGSRRMTAWLRTQGRSTASGLYGSHLTSKPAPEHRIYLAVDREAADITYLPMSRGLYLVDYGLAKRAIRRKNYAMYSLLWPAAGAGEVSMDGKGIPRRTWKFSRRYCLCNGGKKLLIDSGSGQDLCRRGIQKLLEEEEPSNLADLILGAGYEK